MSTILKWKQMKVVAAEVNDSSQQKPNKIKAEIDELIVKDSET